MIVFPMAGLSSRFTRAGYNRPKWMLPLADRPLFDWSLLGFSAYFASQPFLVIHLNRPGVGDFVARRCREMAIADHRLVALANPTLGQADTVRLGIDQAGVPDGEPLTIFNIDTIRPGFVEFAAPPQMSGWLETFQGEGDHWSFVRPSDDVPGLAVEVTEKRRISSHCCTGLYHFATAGLYRQALQREEAAPSMTELYVAPLYQRLIEAGHQIGFTTVGPDEIFFSGTPDEYTAALAREGEIAAAF